MAAFPALIVVALSSFTAAADVLWNIDCGSSRNYTDGNNVTWTGDSALVRTGKSKSVQSSYSMTPVQDTLRVFASGERNCYFIGAEKGAKVILLAHFYYGNYDGKSSPPRFDLEIDGNDWATIVTDISSDYYIYYEFIFVVKGDNISVCFVQTHRDQFPFISALEIRSLPSDMYRDLDPGHALHNQGRYVFGFTQSSVPDDYDRTWDPAAIVGSGYSIVARSNTSAVDTEIVPDKPPQATMDNAMTTSNTSARSLKLPLSNNLPISPSPIYINMYFTELTELINSTQKRTFTVNVDDKPVQPLKPITPTYGNATELSIYNVIASQNTTFRLVLTADSMLPPVISAIELFFILNYTQTSPRPYETPSSKSKLPIILGAGIPGFFFLVAFAAVIVRKYKKKRAAKAAATTNAATSKTGEKEVESGSAEAAKDQGGGD